MRVSRSRQLCRAVYAFELCHGPRSDGWIHVCWTRQVAHYGNVRAIVYIYVRVIGHHRSWPLERCKETAVNASEKRRSVGYYDTVWVIIITEVRRSNTSGLAYRSSANSGSPRNLLPEKIAVTRRTLLTHTSSSSVPSDFGE